MPATLEFDSVIKINGVNPYVLVSRKQAERLKKNWRRPLPVLVRINHLPKKAWKINLIPSGRGSFYLYLHGEVRKASRTKVGDRVRAEVSFDQSYRPGPSSTLPGWFRDFLATDKKASDFWTALTPSLQKEIIRYYSKLKTPEAKKKNEGLIRQIFKGAKIRYTGREWNIG